MKIKNLTLLASLLLVLLVTHLDLSAKNKEQAKVVVAYVTSWSNVMPDPMLMTHLNYAFGGVNKTFDGVDVANPDRLKSMVLLKQKNPRLKVLLSVGGWGAGRFSEMAASDECRWNFAEDCKKIVANYHLDGIDIDWEYPTQSSANISSSPQDTEHFTLLMRDLRKALGKKKLLTCATVASGEYIDFKSCIKYLDFVNVMSYDMGNPPVHHSALFPSEISGWMTSSAAVESHLKKGVPADKLVMGMPFYGRGDQKYHPYTKNHHLKVDATEKWSEASQVPYLEGKDGKLVFGFENNKSLARKCQYIIDNHLRGGMYWDYADNNTQLDFSKILALSLLKNNKATMPTRRVLVIAEEGTPHQGFVDAAHEWLDKNAQRLNIETTFVADMRQAKCEPLDHYHLILQLNYPPFAWSQDRMEELVDYIDHGKGSYIGFHHASLLGDIFGAGDMWQWFSDFMGGVRWKDYVRETADGILCIETPEHPVMKDVPDTVLIPKDEWYTYDRSPRRNAHVQVLAHVDEHSYQPSSAVRMGDHPVVWVNEEKAARNVYFQIGHDKSLFQTNGFLKMWENALHWALFDE